MRFSFVLLLLVLFTGCSKVAVFEPAKVEKRLGYKERLGTEVANTTDSGASLLDGRIITSDQASLPTLESGFVLLSIDNGWSVSTNGTDQLVVVSPSGNKTVIKTDEKPLTASTDGKLLAVTTQTNAHKVIDLATEEILFFTQEKLVLTADRRGAKPFIDDDQIIFASLDGKLIFVSKPSYKTKKELVVGYDEFFNNPIFLGFHEGSFVSATASRVVATDQSGTVHSLEKETKQLIRLDSGLYHFALDGTVTKISGRLESLASTKVPFARIVGAVESKSSIYLVEQSGWIIKLATDLSSYKVYELPDIASMPLFASKDKLYYGRKAIYWP